MASSIVNRLFGHLQAACRPAVTFATSAGWCSSCRRPTRLNKDSAKYEAKKHAVGERRWLKLARNHLNILKKKARPKYGHPIWVEEYNEDDKTKDEKLAEITAEEGMPNFSMSQIEVRFPYGVAMVVEFKKDDVIRSLYEVVKTTLARVDPPFILSTSPYC